MRPLALPPVIGHRGAAALAPENTLAGFRLAKTMGCTWIEFDVRLTADGGLVICHDDRLERTTDGRGRVLAQTLAAIHELDAGKWFAAEFAGEHMPTLEQTLALCRDSALGANIEIKAERGYGRATAAAVAACLVRFAGGSPPVLVSSFLAEAVSEIAERAPDAARGMLFRKIPRDWQGIAESLGCSTINADQLYLSERVISEVRSRGYPLLAYTVNEPARARQLFAWGVTSVFSDAPDIIMAAAAPEIGDGARRGVLG
jgi:glycerophosphoryl diester phosphodiesterase